MVTTFYVLLVLAASRLRQEITDPPGGWERVGVITLFVVIISVGGGLLLTEKLRIGSTVIKQVELLNQQITEAKASGDRRVAEANTYWEKRFNDQVAQDNQRLADTNTGWRERYNEVSEDRKFWRDRAQQPVQMLESLVKIMEELKDSIQVTQDQPKVMDQVRMLEELKALKAMIERSTK